MAKALFGHLATDPRGADRLAGENARLRSRINDLENLVARLQDENDRLVAERTEQMTADALASGSAVQMLPA